MRDEVNDVFYQQLVAVNNASQGSYVVDFGLLLYSKKFYFGISSSDMVAEKFSGDTNLNFSDVLIETTGGRNPIVCHGHTKGDAVEMKRIIEKFQSERFGAGT